jgi:histidinol-phosphate aminotransferase
VLERPDVLDQQRGNPRERGRRASALQSMPGARAFHSDANVVLFQVPRADAVFSGLKARGILIKNVNGSHPSLTDCLRVTVGTPDENDQFLSGLRQSLLQAA